MRNRYVVPIAVLLFIVLAAPAFAAPPSPGLYFSTDQGGLVLTGRGSNSRADNSGIGDVFNAMSWDGSGLGTQWSFTCGVSTNQTVDNNLDVNGNGTVTLTTNYSGGTFFLGAGGPWGDGSESYTGSVNYVLRITTLTYFGGTLAQARENYSASGTFANGCHLDFAVGNGVGIGDTDTSAFPASGYPALVDADCSTPRASGSWGDVKDITLLIDCSTPARPVSWGTLKSLYK